MASLFIFTVTPPTEIYTLSLHDALPISIEPDQRRERRALVGIEASVETDVGLVGRGGEAVAFGRHLDPHAGDRRSEEHTSELQSQFHLVCRLLLEKKKLRAIGSPALPEN